MSGPAGAPFYGPAWEAVAMPARGSSTHGCAVQALVVLDSMQLRLRLWPLSNLSCASAMPLYRQSHLLSSSGFHSFNRLMHHTGKVSLALIRHGSVGTDSDSEGDDIEVAERSYDSGLALRAQGDHRRSVFELSKALALFTSGSERAMRLSEYHRARQLELESANVLMSLLASPTSIWVKNCTAQSVTKRRSKFDPRSSVKR